MRLDVLLEIKKDKKLHEYLRTHSYWYRFLNRDPVNLEKLKKEYKSFKREENMNKVNETIDNI